MNTTHSEILAVNELIQPLILEWLNTNPDKTLHLFEAVGLVIEYFELSSESATFDIKSGRGLLRILVEWRLWELHRDKKIHRVGPNTYQSLNGDLPEYNENTLAVIKTRSFTVQKHSVNVSVKLLVKLGHSKEQIVSELRESPSFKDCSPFVFYSSVSEAFSQQNNP